jgi:hypothetical protein
MVLILRLKHGSDYLFSLIKACFRGERTTSFLWMISGPKGHHSTPSNTIRPKDESAAPHPGRRPDSQPNPFSIWSGVQDRRRRPAKPAAEGRP